MQITGFRDVKNYGLKKYCSLKRSTATSVSSCLEVVDLDFDGEDELLIGNSAKVYIIKYLFVCDNLNLKP